METPGERKPIRSERGCDLLSAKDVSRGQAQTSKKMRNNTNNQEEQGENVSQDAPVLRLLHFQYRYPGTPISTIAVPQNASDGRVMIVFNVHAAPMMT